MRNRYSTIQGYFSAGLGLGTDAQAALRKIFTDPLTGAGFNWPTLDCNVAVLTRVGTPYVDYGTQWASVYLATVEG